MFKNLSTSRKLFILCSMFVIALGVTTYSLVTEKLIAIEFARKEVAGNRYLDTIRRIYEAVLIGRGAQEPAASPEMSSDSLLKALADAEAETGDRFQTAALEQALAAKLGVLWSNEAVRSGSADPIVDAVAAARDLAQRIGDDSNLTLDPDLDTYYVQNIIVQVLPALLGQLGELAMLSPEASAAPEAGRTRLLVLDGLLHASTESIGDDLASAYRGNLDGRLKPAVDAAFAAMVSATDAYADASAASVSGAGNVAALGGNYASAVESAISAWSVAARELDRLLGQRIDGLVHRLETSLLLTAVLGGLSILLAVLTHRHIVRPLVRFESVARTIREMKIYSLRVDESSSDEIGRLATSFNAMLSELATAREREITEQSELARVTRSTAMGAMTASIAHEINQPLAAIVTNSNAAIRWLGNATPNVEEARAALKRISADGHRASEVISGIRAMFKRDASHRVAIDTNKLIREVLLLANTTLQAQKTVVETDLREGLAEVQGDRTQLQQVLLNLIINAAESMGSVTDRARLLLVRSDIDDHGGVLVAVADSGTGIAQTDLNRVFDAFFTTKSSGMGMGLFICRSIIESHGGRLWAAPRFPHGTVFYVAMPGDAAGDE